MKKIVYSLLTSTLLSFFALAQNPTGNSIRIKNENDFIPVRGIDLNNSSFTIEFIARSTPGSFAEKRSIISQMTEEYNSGLQIGYNETNNFYFSFGNSVLKTEEKFNDDKWHHWVCTFNPGNNLRQIYYDGKLVAYDFTESFYYGTGTLFIGKSAVLKTNLFNGDLDEIRIWSSERSYEEIQENIFSELTGKEENLLAYWNFDEFSGALTRKDLGYKNFDPVENSV